MKKTVLVISLSVLGLSAGEVSEFLYSSMDGREKRPEWSYYVPMPDYDRLDASANYDRPGATDDQDRRMMAVARNCTGEDYARLFYGNGWSFQVRRALYERALDFYEPLNQVCREAYMDFRNIPCLPPGEARSRWNVWTARYGAPHLCRIMFPVVAGRMYCCTNAAPAILEAYSDAIGHRVTIPDASLAGCREYDSATNSYCLYPIGIAIHRADDACEEFRHFHNFCFPIRRDFCEGFTTPSVRSVTSWNEFAAAFAGLKVDAWAMGIDFGVPGGSAEYVDAVLSSDPDLSGLSARVPKNSQRLLAAYLEARLGGDESADYTKIRTWFESDSVGRKVL